RFRLTASFRANPPGVSACRCATHEWLLRRYADQVSPDGEPLSLTARERGQRDLPPSSALAGFACESVGRGGAFRLGLLPRRKVALIHERHPAGPSRHVPPLP